MARYRGASMEGRSNYGRGLLMPPEGWTRTYRPDGSYSDSGPRRSVMDLPAALRPTGAALQRILDGERRGARRLAALDTPRRSLGAMAARRSLANS